MQLYKHRNPKGSINGGPREELEATWGDDVIVDAALDFAKRHQDQPFLAFVSAMTPHGPLDAPEEDIERFMRERGLSRKVATLHAQMAVFDRAIGRLIQGLEDLDTSDRETRVLFLSDNGPAMFENDFTHADRARRNVLGWRGWKGDVWEAGIRSPLFIHRIGSIDQGEITQPADATDLLPTVLGWAGLDTAGTGKPLDGRDIRPMLAGEEIPDKPIPSWIHPAIPPWPGRGEERKLQDEYGPLSPAAKKALNPEEQVMALRKGDWKLVWNADLNTSEPPETDRFFGNVVTDPRETTNLLHLNPEQVNRMAQDMVRWFEDIKAEPQSFQPPELQIPDSGDVTILSSWASHVHPDLYNNVPATEGFDSAGQTVRWNLRVHKTRSVEPELLWFKDGKLPADSQIALRSGDAEVIGNSDVEGNLNWDGLLELDAGPATLELEILTLPHIDTPLDLLFLFLRDPE